MNGYNITSPKDEIDFQNYYYFRWEYLRKPLNKKLGSEKDSIEDLSIHRMIKNIDGLIVGVGRIHEISSTSFQIRYFAINKKFRRIGLGTYLMNDLEKTVLNRKGKLIILNARDNAVSFYENLGYNIVKKTNLLYGKIQHYEMIKKII